MLTFATEFPVDHASTAENFLSAIKNWILESPHTVFTEDDLKTIPEEGEFSISRDNQQFRSIAVKMGSEVFIAINHISSDDEIDWKLESVFNHSGFDAWVAVRISRESEAPIRKLPFGKKPVLVRTLLESLGGGSDGGIFVKAQAHLLKNDEIEIPGNIILGKHSHRLPVVYISCGFRGNYDLDTSSLASDLAGMAHVIVEPNRAFSYQLQIETLSANAFGGTIGIYWPDGTGSKSFFSLRDYTRKKDLKDAIITRLRQSLLNRRPFYNCTWSAVQEIFSKNTYEKLKLAGSQNVDDYTRAFDKELTAKDQRLLGADREIERLKSEIRKYENQPQQNGGIQLKITNEQQFYYTEFTDMLVDILSDSIRNVDADSRRSHLLRDLIQSNKSSGQNQAKKERIKKIFKDYTKMNASIRSELDDLGFTITEEGKHYKAIYQDDSRYTFVISKSGSDYRSGMNLASDITKKIL